MLQKAWDVVREPILLLSLAAALDLLEPGAVQPSIGGPTPAHPVRPRKHSLARSRPETVAPTNQIGPPPPFTRHRTRPATSSPGCARTSWH
jgi:hypothetical protein